MRKIKELEDLLCNPKAGLVIQIFELRLLAQHHEWSLVWNALVFATLRGYDSAILKRVQDEIRFPERNLRMCSHEALPQHMSHTLPGNAIWKNRIIPYLILRDQIYLSQTNRYFFKISFDLYELRKEFPGYIKNLLKQELPVNTQEQLLTLRALSYPTVESHLRAVFSGVAKSLSPSEFLQIAPAQSLRPYINMERRGDESLAIEKLSPLTLTCSLDKLSTMLFFLSLIDNKKSEQTDQILNLCCKYGSTSIVRFFLWAFPDKDALKFDPHLPVACRYNRTNLIPLLAPRVQQITMTMCLISVQNNPNSIAVYVELQAQGAKFSERVIDYTSDSPCYSTLMTEIIRIDLPVLLSIFLKRWPKTSLDSVLYHILHKYGPHEKLPLNIIAYILFAKKSIQLNSRTRINYINKTPFIPFIHQISKGNQLNSFLNIYVPKWRVQLLPSSVSKIVTAVCRAGLIENFQALLNYGINININYPSKKHVLSSPLSRAAFFYSKSPVFFDSLIEKGAVFSPLAVCHAIEGGQLTGLEALMQLPDASIQNYSLEYNPLFVAAQFGRLSCFDFLLSKGISLEGFTLDQLWDLLIQGPIAGLLKLRDRHAFSPWLGPLHKMRNILLEKMMRVEIGNKYGFPEADPFEFQSFLKEKAAIYLKIISMILPCVKERIIGNDSILSIAVSTNNVTLVNLVLAYSPTLNAVDEQGRSILLVAAEQGNCEMVTLLLEYGIDFTIEEHLESPEILKHKNLQILAILINSKQYAALNFPNLPNKNRSESCLQYLAEKSNNPINPQLAEVLYERYRLHEDVAPLQLIQKKVEEVTLGKGWREHVFNHIIINNAAHAAPGIIAEIYKLISEFFKLEYSMAIAALPALYQSIQDLIERSKGFRLRFYSSTTVEILKQIEDLISDKNGHPSKVSATINR